MAGNVKGITIEFRGETTKLDSAIKQINRETRGLDTELRKVNNALKFNPTSVDLWRQKQTLLKNKIAETQDKLKLLKQQQANLDASGVDKSSKEYRELERDIIETESKLKHFNAELIKTGSAKLTALGEQFKSVGSKMTAVGKTLTMYVTAPLVGLGGAAAKNFAEVDKTMQLTNATMKNTEEEAKQLDKAMKDAAGNSTYSMQETATATLNFARAGLDAEQSASALAPALNLAAGEGGNLDTVSAGLVATINGFQDSFENAGEYADVFANACNNTALEIDGLVSSMSIAAPVFKTVGYDVSDAALYMGVMANNGIDANVSANALKTGIARLASPSKQGAEWMEKLGINIFNADGTMKDSVTVQKELHDAFSTLSEKEQVAAASAIFGKNQMSNWLSLINTAPGDVKSLSDSLKEEGTTAEMADKMMSGFGGSLEKLKSSIDVASSSFGEALAPMILKVSNAIQKLVDWFNQLSPQAQQIVAVITVIVAAIGPVLVILGVLISSIGTIITFAGTLPGLFAAAGAAIGAVAAPVAIVIGIIAALITIGVLLYKNWDTIKAKATELWNALKSAFNNIKTTISNAWTAIKVNVSNAVNAVKTTVTNVFNAVKNTIKTIWTAIKTTISSVWNGIKSTISSVISSIKSTVSSTFDAVKTKVTDIWKKIKKAIEDPIKKARDTVQSVVDKIKGFFPVKIGKIMSGLKLPHFKLSGKFDLKSMSVPHVSVSWYKKGGIFDSPTIAGIGEAGPEAVVPLDKLWNKLDAIAENAGGPQVVINVAASPGMDVNQLAAEIERRIIASTNRRRMAWQ